jgi:hypothetical protein
LHAIVRHQQPAATASLYGMELIARGGLRDLVEESMSIEKHHGSHRCASRQLSFKQRCLHSQARAGDLNINAGGRSIVSQDQW